MKTLYEHQMIIKLETKDVVNYMINPYIFFRGKDLEKTVVSGFAETRWAKYNEEILQKIEVEGKFLIERKNVKESLDNSTIKNCT